MRASVHRAGLGKGRGGTWSLGGRGELVRDVGPQGCRSSFPSSRSEIRLGRSESLKGREEMKRSRKADNVPRSRSDVDMDAAAEAARLHQSASSSASSLSTRWAGLGQLSWGVSGQGQRGLRADFSPQVSGEPNPSLHPQDGPQVSGGSRPRAAGQVCPSTAAVSRGRGAGETGGGGPRAESFLLFPRSIESPNLGFGADALLPHLLEDDLGQLSDLELEPDAQNWQHMVGKDVVAGLSQREIDRQEVINGEHVPLCLGRVGGRGW